MDSYRLIVAGIISGVLGEMVDAIALLAIIVGGGVAGSASCVTRLRCLNESAEAIVPDHGPMASFANCGLP